MREEAGDRIFDIDLDPMCIIDGKGRIREANRALVDMLGYDEEELCSRKFSDLAHSGDREDVGRELNQIKEGEKAAHLVVRTRSRDGSYRHLSWNIKKSPEGEYVFASARDITRLMEAKDKLREAQQEKEEVNKDLEAFSYSVSHDLRTPLRAISGFSQILREDHADKLDEEGLRLLEVVIDNTRKMGTLIDDMLAFSRLTRASFEKDKVNMNQLFSDAYMIATEAVPDLREKIEVDIQDLPEGFGDLSLLKQAAVNLLTNAIKYSSGNERIDIEVGSTQREDAYVYYVRDNGVGFDMKYADKLFGVFQRLHSSSEYEGTGVGLSIVKRVINHHGGEVWAESEPGEGAVFYFSLPKSDPKTNGEA